VSRGHCYNYFGIDVDASIDDSGIRNLSDDASQRIFGAVGARVQGAVDAEVQKLASFLAMRKPSWKTMLATELPWASSRICKRDCAETLPVAIPFEKQSATRMLSRTRGTSRPPLG
jgi:hypothetical protein